jgi:fatty-acid peroxygenase
VAQIPRDQNLDNSLALLSDGYTFISKRCERLQSDVFETRLMLSKAICTMGEDAARMFYHPDRFTRVRAMPPTVLFLLQDVGSVQQLDDNAHHHRKQMFMSMMNPASIAKLTENFSEQWRAHIKRWETKDEVILYSAVNEILCRAVCTWAAVPLKESEVQARTHEFAAMIDGSGAVGPKNWWAQRLRRRTEKWAREIITQVREHKLEVPTESALHTIAWHRQLNEELLDLDVAVVELLNVLRPTVAVARYIVFAALALHHYPECRQRLLSGDEEYLTFFVQEVRRFYPFFPLIGGRVRQEFEWRSHHFTQGTWVLLDVYGTNHDARIWKEPQTFQPERFREWAGSPFSFIPQGGGEYDHDHRCAGEWITIELTKTAVRLLTTAMAYAVPAQDLSISLSKMPALPTSHFVIRQV